MNAINTVHRLGLKSHAAEPMNKEEYRRRLEMILEKEKSVAGPAPQPQKAKQELKNEPIKKAKIVAIGGSKGGIGKTSFTASLALELSAQGQKVIAVDADFGDPDLKDWLGLRQPRATLDHFFRQEIPHLKDIVLQSAIPNLQVICGDSQSMETSYPFFGLRMRFLKQLKELYADYVLLDLGPGISYNNIDTFLAADDRILVLVPEPSSIISAFRFLRIAVIRHLKKVVRGYPPVLNLIAHYEMPEWHNKFASIAPLIKKVERMNLEAAEKMQRALQTFSTKLVLNMVMSATEVQEGALFAHAVDYLLRIKATYLGPVAYNEAFRTCSKEQRPFLILDDKENPALKAHSPRFFPWSKLGHKKRGEEAGSSESIVKNIFGPLVPNWPDSRQNHVFSFGQPN